MSAQYAKLNLKQLDILMHAVTMKFWGLKYSFVCWRLMLRLMLTWLTWNWKFMVSSTGVQYSMSLNYCTCTCLSWVKWLTNLKALQARSWVEDMHIWNVGKLSVVKQGLISHIPPFTAIWISGKVQTFEMENTVHCMKIKEQCNRRWCDCLL